MYVCIYIYMYIYTYTCINMFVCGQARAALQQLKTALLASGVYIFIYVCLFTNI